MCRSDSSPTIFSYTVFHLIVFHFRCIHSDADFYQEYDVPTFIMYKVYTLKKNYTSCRRKQSGKCIKERTVIRLQATFLYVTEQQFQPPRDIYINARVWFYPLNLLIPNCNPSPQRAIIHTFAQTKKHPIASCNCWPSTPPRELSQHGVPSSHLKRVRGAIRRKQLASIAHLRILCLTSFVCRPAGNKQAI